MKCLLGLTKYSRDPNFLAIKTEETQQRKEIGSPTSEELNLITIINTLEGLKMNIPDVAKMISEHQLQLTKLRERREARTSEALTETESKKYNWECIRKQENDFLKEL